MPNQNVDLATFLGGNPYYQDAAARAAAPVPAAPATVSYPNNIYDPSVEEVRYGGQYRMAEQVPVAEGGTMQTGRQTAPVQSIDLAAFLGNNPAYNQTPAAAQQPATDPRGTRNPKYDGMVFIPEKIPEDLYLPATPAPSNVTLGPPGMNYGNMNEQYFTQAPMGPMPAYQNPYVGIAGLLNR